PRARRARRHPRRSPPSRPGRGCGGRRRRSRRAPRPRAARRGSRGRGRACGAGGSREASVGHSAKRGGRRMHIDHVIYATQDLDAALARLESEHGLVADGGGRHTGIGTENRIFPLGGGYLELIAVADYAEAERSALGHELAKRIRERGEGLMGWVVAVDDVIAEAGRTGAELSTIERDGLRARLAGVATAM